MMILLTALMMTAVVPAIEHARIESIRVEGSLDGTIRRIAERHEEPVWIGYSIESAEPGGWSSCCCSELSGWRHSSGPCSLEDDSHCMTSGNDRTTDSGHRDLLILARLRHGRVDTIRTLSDDCILDGGGRLLYWIEEVGADESLEWLSKMIEEKGDLSERGLMAMSMHAGERSIDLLIERARSPYPASVRGKALFWLAHRAGNRVVGTLTEALDDPETEIKKAAVFGLSQLPPDEGVPLLIKVAREHGNREVRRDAIFWLGQSRDPRAFDFIVGILKG